MLMASSVRPAPMRPTSPTTSPRRTVKLTFFIFRQSGRSGSRTVQFSTARATSPEGCVSRLGNRSTISRPTMPLMIRSSRMVRPALSRVSITAPSRRTVIRSAIFSTSFSLWEMMMDVIPSDLRSRSSVRSRPLSSSFSAAVGSSRMSSRTCLERALAISTSCCLPTPRSFVRADGFSFR